MTHSGNIREIIEGLREHAIDVEHEELLSPVLCYLCRSRLEETAWQLRHIRYPGGYRATAFYRVDDVCYHALLDVAGFGMGKEGAAQPLDRNQAKGYLFSYPAKRALVQSHWAYVREQRLRAGEGR